ncbi:hypothetical protein BBta_p0036 (plasmid) [Bradyrhizobium sp. BTAi1]|nr:hypothetical protein BBta_p0036 [Bradyrhizobium sp. BTAi1]
MSPSRRVNRAIAFTILRFLPEGRRSADNICDPARHSACQGQVVPDQIEMWYPQQAGFALLMLWPEFEEAEVMDDVQTSP